MVRYKQTHEILNLIQNREKVRNIGIIAHVDHGKCLTGDSVVFLADGSLVKIEDLFNIYSTKDEYGPHPAKIKILSFNPIEKKVVRAESCYIWKLKKNKLVRIKLRNGYEIVTTPEHPFFTLNKLGILESIKAEKLSSGMYIAVPNYIPVNDKNINLFKREVIRIIFSKNYYYLYVDDYFRNKIKEFSKSIGIKKLYNEGVGSSYKVLQESLLRGRFRSSDLKAIISMMRVSYEDVYEHVTYVGYRKGGWGRVSKFKLPKSVDEIKKALYIVGLLYGDGSSNTSFDNSNKEMLKLFESGLFEAFGLVANYTIGRTTIRAQHTGGRAFTYFLRDVFSYPLKAKSSSVDIPKMILTLGKEYIAMFIRGLFDTDGTVEFGRSAVSLTSVSRSLIYSLGYLLQRFGILPIINTRRKAYTLYITGSDVISYMRYIGFGNKDKYIKCKELMNKAGYRRIGEYIPIDGGELGTYRVAIGFSASDVKIPFYKKYESGSQSITKRIFKNILFSFKKTYEIGRIKEKLKLVKKILNSKNECVLTIRERTLVSSMVKDGILVKRDGNFILTDYGIRIVKIWEAQLNNESDVKDSLKKVFDHWMSILNSDIRFVRIKSVEIQNGDFDVYDLTVPRYHTFISNGIIAHNTTLTDSLLAASGLLSPTVAGEARALDYLEEEQKRGITIKTANISLLHEYKGESYVINLIDTPGHVDFTGKVTRALRAIDGAVVVVDAVEEVMVQTETVTRQALQERVKPILFINKVDRLITELRLGPQDIQKKLVRIINRFNKLIEIFGEEGFRDKWIVKPDLNNVAFGSAKDRWGFTLKQALSKGMTFNDVLKFYEEGRLKELRELFPIHQAVLDMVIEHIPTPIVAQKYRIPKIWRGDLNSEIGQSMLNCDENGPVAFMVTNVMVDERAGLVATGRLLSGTLRPGTDVYLINRGTKDRILQVGMYMGPYREVVDHMIAGNIPAVLGLDNISAGETVSSNPDMYPFEAIRYISEPVVTVSIEPKNTRELPKLINYLRKLAIEDPNLHVKINEETGEYLLSGMGTLHLEVSLHFLQDMGLEVTVSPPIVVYRETITRNSPIFPGKSPNKHNKIKVKLEKLSEDVVDLIVTNKLNERIGRREVQKILMDYGWRADEARSVWAIDNESGNILVDMTKGVQYLQESKQMLIGAFYDFVKEGALAREPVRGVKVVILDAVFHEDPAHRTLAQVIPMMHRALLGAELTSEPSLFEPIMRIQVQVPSDLIGAVTSVLASKRGQVTNIDQREYYSVVNGYIPVSETFDLAQVLRSATAGRAFWQTQFSHWQLIPKSLLMTVVSNIRKRKGLSERPPEYKEFIPPGEQIEAVTR